MKTEEIKLNNRNTEALAVSLTDTESQGTETKFSEYDTEALRLPTEWNLYSLEKLMESINKYGQLYPIIVNEKMEIVDGEARLEACKRLGIPVKYMVIPGLGMDERIALNWWKWAYKLTEEVYEK